MCTNTNTESQPVRDMFLEDVLERTGFTIGRSSKWVAAF